MESTRWINQSQPPMLVYATIWLYIRAAFGLLFGLGGGPLGLLLALGYGASGLGIANEKRWGYRLGVALAALLVLFGALALLSLVDVGYFGSATGYAVISLMFDVALLFLLVNTTSRSYARMWFR